MICKSHFRFDHPELNQVTTCFGFFSTEGRSERIYFPKRHRSSFHVKLTTLRQICILIKIFRMEQVGCSFCRCRCQNRRIYQGKTILIKKLLNCANNFRTNHHNRALFAGTKPQVTMVHQEINAMLFRSNRIIIC
ncbi:hypothetical protein D3C76_507490 [compost metagenome]